MKYCCEFMKEQLNYKCEMHGLNCPDIIIVRCNSRFLENTLMLIGRNAEYACNYCPYCGAKVSDLFNSSEKE